MIWNPSHECLPRADLEALQLQRLRSLVERVRDRVPFYAERLQVAEPIGRLADIARLPFTCKNDLRDHYPFGLFAVPREEVVRIHASSGTTGKPTVVGYTKEDLETWAEVCARCLALSGARPGQVFQNAYGYGLFTGGLGMHYGAERMGLTVVPVSGGNTARQIMLLQDFGTEVLACTPSYALSFADGLAERGIDPGTLKLKTCVLGAEPWTDLMRAEIEARLRVNAVNIYGLSEIIGPGVSNECVEAKSGSHVCEDHFLVEAVDPKTGDAVADGEVGELVFTTLTKQALPLIRYRTGDLASLSRDSCSCGRTTTRMSRIVGRTDDMLIIRGVNVFPSQIESALLSMEDLSPHYQLVVTRPRHLDELEVCLEVSAEFFQRVGTELFADSSRVHEDVDRLAARVRKTIHETLGLHVVATLRPPGTLPRSEGGKLSRVLDRRGE